MKINAIQDEIIAEFEAFDDWMDRYSLIIDYGNDLQPLTENDRSDANLIDGCQAKVWIVMDEKPSATEAKTAEYATEEPTLFFRGDSDAILVKGIVALLLRVLSGHSPAEILDADLYFLDAIHLREHLSPSRTNGLNAMLERIRQYARSFQK